MKAVLVMDMPECCNYCPLGYFLGIGGATGCRAMNDRVNRDGQVKANWCPLKMLPEGKQPEIFSVGSLIEEYYSEYNRGFNDCLDAIGGNTE